MSVFSSMPLLARFCPLDRTYCEWSASVGSPQVLPSSSTPSIFESDLPKQMELLSGEVTLSNRSLLFEPRVIYAYSVADSSGTNIFE